MYVMGVFFTHTFINTTYISYIMDTFITNTWKKKNLNIPCSLCREWKVQPLKCMCVCVHALNQRGNGCHKMKRLENFVTSILIPVLMSLSPTHPATHTHMHSCLCACIHSQYYYWFLRHSWNKGKDKYIH